MKTKHTPGPWKVMADPVNKGKHPFHDSRWIATANSEVEMSYVPNDWSIENGSLICELRDGDTTANAHLIAAAPELLEALKESEKIIAIARWRFPRSIDNRDRFQLENTNRTIIKAIAKAEGR